MWQNYIAGSIGECDFRKKFFIEIYVSYYVIS
jgi:hypothetical protein